MKEISITFSATVMVEDNVSPQDIKILVQHENVALESKLVIKDLEIIENLDEPYLPIVMNQWFECTSPCPYQSDCAQGVGAGDYRSEGGMTPRLKKEGDQILCQSVSMPAEDDIAYGPMPRGHHNGGQWVLSKETGELIMHADYLRDLDDDD